MRCFLGGCVRPWVGFGFSHPRDTRRIKHPCGHLRQVNAFFLLNQDPEEGEEHIFLYSVAIKMRIPLCFFKSVFA